MTKSDDLVKRHRDECEFKFAPLDVCDCVEKNMADHIGELEAALEWQCGRAEKAENEVARLREALREIDGKIDWEINPSNYGHQEVCDMNSDWCEVGDIARAALQEGD